MHALGEFIREQMDAQGLTQASLARLSRLSKQHISTLLDDSRTRLGGMIEEKTVAGLARALHVDEAVIITKAAEAMGIPLDRLQVVQTVVTVSPAEMSDEALIRELASRLARARVADPGYESDEESMRDPLVDSGSSAGDDKPVPNRQVGKGRVGRGPDSNTATETPNGETTGNNLRPFG